jgi:HK97 family phage major capsid protein
MNIKQLKEQRDALLNQMQSLAQSDKFDAEKRSKFDAMNADVANLEGDITRLESVAKFESEQRSIPRSQPGASIENDNASVEERSAKENRAFNKFIKTGLLEGRDVTTSTAQAFVPQLFQNILTDALKYYGPIATIVQQKRTTGGQPLKVALDNDTMNSISILGEATAVSEVDPTFTSQILSTDTLSTGLVKVSVQELQDSYFDIDSFIRNKFGIRYGRGLEGWITNGNSSNVASLVTSAYASTTALGNTLLTGSDGSNSIGYSDITALFSSLDPAYIGNSTWLMNNMTRGFLLGVKDTLGRPLFIPNPTSGSFDQLLGRPVVLDQALPNIAPSAVGTILFGDFQQGYLFRTDGDLEIIRLNERYMDTLEVGFVGFARVGGMSLDAGTHPIVKLTQSAT